jgi:hypothetical protein
MMTATISALTVASALTLNAQAPQAPSPQTPAPQAPAPRESATSPQHPDAQATTAGQTITITGCLKQEKDVAGLTPNPAERVGVAEDYVLTGVKMAASSAVSGLGVADRYEVEGVDNSELKKHVDHQVELTGTITQATATSTDKTPDFKATSIKMLAASCTAQ